MLLIKITGHPGEGKSTLAVIIARALKEVGLCVEHDDDIAVPFYTASLPLPLRLQQSKLVRIESQ